ncbi:hypothetical protein Ahy_A10g047779 isoform C [Arachis hypogaea]|uniref:Uncharacterized protein n=1 Tax=Arachis hypogaea TaxID=3818 RepID=A0A444X7T9_ARAHY|nr:hypothetical protein Ahy_B10g105355 isoform C [Arachis hypogaea]RYR33220.1 hypothetical protein Ahy_A10g047779 isoform C [Arachis hypogaea]
MSWVHYLHSCLFLVVMLSLLNIDGINMVLEGIMLLTVAGVCILVQLV